MTTQWRTDLKQLVDLAVRYTAGAEEGMIELFFEGIRALPKKEASSIVNEIGHLEVDDDIRTFVERSYLFELAKREDLTQRDLLLFFECDDYESLMSLSKNRHLDDFSRRRAVAEAKRIKMAYMSRF